MTELGVEEVDAPLIQPGAWSRFGLVIEVLEVARLGGSSWGLIEIVSAPKKICQGYAG